MTRSTNVDYRRTNAGHTDLPAPAEAGIDSASWSELFAECRRVLVARQDGGFRCIALLPSPEPPIYGAGATFPAAIQAAADELAARHNYRPGRSPLALSPLFRGQISTPSQRPQSLAAGPDPRA